MSFYNNGFPIETRNYFNHISKNIPKVFHSSEVPNNQYTNPNHLIWNICKGYRREHLAQMYDYFGSVCMC